MQNPTKVQSPDQVITTARIIRLALITGIILMGPGCIFASQIGVGIDQQNLKIGPIPVLPVIALFVAVQSLGVSTFLSSTMIKTARKKLSETKSPEAITGVYSGLTIVQSALAEGAALCSLVIFLIGGEWYLLAIPVLAIAYMLVTMPSKEGLRVFAEKVTSES